MSVIPRSRNPTYLIVAGSIVAVLGFIIVFLLVSQPGNVTLPGTRSVLVSARAISAHAQLGSADLRVAQYPANLVPEGAFNAVNQATGKFTVAAIPAGEPITPDLLVATAQAAASSGVDIPSGQVAVVLPPSDARTLVSGLVQNGDRVDILVNGLPGQSPGSVATTFTGLPIQVVPGALGGPSQWIVYLSLQQAEQLQYLLLNGQYHFVVRTRKDTNAEQPAPPVLRDDFNRAFGIH